MHKVNVLVYIVFKTLNDILPSREGVGGVLEAPTRIIRLIKWMCITHPLPLSRGDLISFTPIVIFRTEFSTARYG